MKKLPFLNEASNKALVDYLTYYEKNNYLQGNLLLYQAGETPFFYQNSYGFANIQLGVKNSINTKFKIASLTKAFTSMLVFILQEKERVHINDSVNSYLPNCVASDAITIYHCLTHSAGIPDFASAENYWYTTMREPHTLDELIASMRRHPLLFQPGTSYAYSSTGYLIVTQIIEKVTGNSYANCLKEYILSPLQMNDTGCMNDSDLVMQLADSYGFWKTEVQAAKTDMTFPTGAAGMYSTTTDLLKWSQAILDRKLLSVESYQSYLKPFQSTYACGWDITSIYNNVCFQHQGDLDGFVSSIKIFDELQLIVILLSNVELIPVTTITRQLSEIILGNNFHLESRKIKFLKEEAIQKFVGVYFFNGGKNKITLSCEEGTLFLTVTKRYDIEYKCKISPFIDKQGRIILQTDRIHEMLLFSDTESKYITFTGETFTLQKNVFL